MVCWFELRLSDFRVYVKQLVLFFCIVAGNAVNLLLFEQELSARAHTNRVLAYRALFMRTLENRYFKPVHRSVPVGLLYRSCE